MRDLGSKLVGRGNPAGPQLNRMYEIHEDLMGEDARRHHVHEVARLDHAPDDGLTEIEAEPDDAVQMNARLHLMQALEQLAIEELVCDELLDGNAAQRVDLGRALG